MSLAIYHVLGERHRKDEQGREKHKMQRERNFGEKRGRAQANEGGGGREEGREGETGGD